MKKRSIKWGVIIRRVLLVIFGAVLGVNVYLANAKNLLGNSLPMPFGYGAAMVLSGSMEPTLSRGDLIIVKQTDGEFEKGDIVVFQDVRSLVVHKIVSVGEETVVTRGDANNADDGPILKENVLGEVIFWIPYLGSAVGFLKTPVGTVCVILAAIALVEIPRRKEKEKDDEERQKIIDEIKRLKEEQGK